MKKKLNIVIALNYDLCQVMAGFFIKKLKKESIEQKSINILQKALFKPAESSHISFNFLSNAEFESFMQSGGERLHPKLRLVKNNIDLLSVFQQEFFSKENNILYSSDSFLEKNPESFFEELKKKTVEELNLDVSITIIFEDFFDLIRYRFFSAFESFYTGFRFFNINELASQHEIPRIRKTIRSIQKINSLFGRENLNFIYQKRDLFQDNFPKDSWEKILNSLQLDDSDFSDNFLAIDIKKTRLTVSPLFNNHLRSMLEKRRRDSNFRESLISEIRKTNQLAELYQIPVLENIHFNSRNSDLIISLNSSLQKITNLQSISKQVLVKSKQSGQSVTFNFLKN